MEFIHDYIAWKPILCSVLIVLGLFGAGMAYIGYRLMGIPKRHVRLASHEDIEDAVRVTRNEIADAYEITERGDRLWSIQ